MLWTLIVIAVLIVLIGGFVFSQMRRYSLMFGDVHYAEVAEGIRTAKAAAIAMSGVETDDAPLTAEDSRVFRTSQNLAVAYTINRDASGFTHHYSISVVGEPTTHAVGERFAAFIARILGVSSVGIGPQQLQCGFSEANVHHVEFEMTPEEEQAFVTLPVVIPMPETAKAINADMVQLREQMRFAPMVIDVQQQK
jgi:hypothetical protein